MLYNDHLRFCPCFIASWPTKLPRCNCLLEKGLYLLLSRIVEMGMLPFLLKGIYYG